MLQTAPLYPQLRHAYLRVFKKPYWDYMHGLREFYRQFVPPGSLVFDAGANVGEYAEAFLDLGARVIAIEPNPELVKTLSRYRGLSIVNAAVGETAGTLPMHLSSSHNLGTLSGEWLEAAKQSKYTREHTWERTITVPVTTLDQLIAQHGTPGFIKVDVEGFELKVLRGLSKMGRYLSFEFTGERIQATIDCLQERCLVGGFNYIIGTDLRFVLPQWVTRQEMIAIAQRDLTRHQYGDIFVRRF